MKNYMLIICFGLSSCMCLGQKIFNVDAKTVYFEIQGNQFNSTLNYELTAKPYSFIKIAYRLGVGTYRVKDFYNNFNPDIILPIGINTLIGAKHHAEIGLGQVISSVVRYDVLTEQSKRNIQMNTQFNIGYRFQKQNGGLMCRISYTPYFNQNNQFNHWGGASIGWIFKK